MTERLEGVKSGMLKKVGRYKEKKKSGRANEGIYTPTS